MRKAIPNAWHQARAIASRPECGCSVSFTPSDVDAYIAGQPYTESGIQGNAPTHDRNELIDFYEWLSKKPNNNMSGGE